MSQKQKRLSPGDGVRVQFRCANATREALLAVAKKRRLSERQAWELAATEWVERTTGPHGSTSR